MDTVPFDRAAAQAACDELTDAALALARATLADDKDYPRVKAKFNVLRKRFNEKALYLLPQACRHIKELERALKDALDQAAGLESERVSLCRQIDGASDD